MLEYDDIVEIMSVMNCHKCVQLMIEIHNKMFNELTIQTWSCCMSGQQLKPIGCMPPQGTQSHQTAPTESARG